MSPLPRAVSFDLDGTLYDQRRLARPLLAAARGRLRFLWAYQRVRRRLRGQVYADGQAFARAELEMLAATLRWDLDAARQRLEQFHEVELPLALRRVGPDVVASPLIEALIRHGVRVAVLSDLPVERKLAALGLAHFGWGCLLNTGDTGALKPHRRSFDVVGRALGVDLSDLVHIGDRHDTDVRGAEQCGARAVWLSRSARRPVEPETLVVPSLSALGAIWGLT